MMIFLNGGKEVFKMDEIDVVVVQHLFLDRISELEDAGLFELKSYCGWLMNETLKILKKEVDNN